MKFYKHALLVISSLSLLTLSNATTAGMVNAEFDSFGDLPRATFGGDGISNDAVAFSSFTASNGDVLTLGLSATRRFQNSALGNNGAGRFFAEAGANDGVPGQPGTRATWNFSIFAEIADVNGIVGAGTETLESLDVRLFYDLDAAFGTDESDLGFIEISVFDALKGGTGSLFEESQNSTFEYLGQDNLGFNTAPTMTSFNPNEGGEYSFLLSSNLGRVAINVEVAEVSAPANAAIFLIGIVGLGALRLRKTK